MVALAQATPVMPDDILAAVFADLSRFGRIAKGAQCEKTQLSVQDKLQRYLLNTNHPKGKDKAIWFEKALGFNLSNADNLAKQDYI
ncbi:hypothetical protein LPW11_21845 [Geomonas sp. RF6]|uniref:DUF6883 domain-containing protein n=1 Tax=Geomonas sp. RF6 TaxID=2897342 RepID=UPI001E2DF764|nr:DUF6883 domain-containing protein [Geomonas sp. RF6]UFS70500.1 hypothetical protein LPW11_21845 [Geomonas sp. RF6]